MTKLANSSLDFFPRSLTTSGDCEFGLVKNTHGNLLAVLSKTSLPVSMVREASSTDRS